MLTYSIPFLAKTVFGDVHIIWAKSNQFKLNAWLIHDESVDLWLNAIHSESDTRISQTINVLESMAYKTEYNANGHQIHMLVY